jgi:hypothetical protein
MGSRWPESVEVGGLLLCSAPASSISRRREHYERMSRAQMKSVNDQLESEEDPRMRTMFREHYSTVSRGFGPEGERRTRRGVTGPNQQP